MKVAEYRKLMKRPKYRARLVTDRDGNRFHSKGELERWRDLLALQSAGQVRQVERQVSVELPAVYENGRRAKLVVDFRYVDPANGRYVYEDFKGYETPLSKLKRACARFCGIEVTVTR